MEKRNALGLAMNRIMKAGDLPRIEQIAAQSNGSSPGGSLCGIPPGEIGELGEKAKALLGETSPTSPISPGGHIQRAVYPEDSILADWMKFGRDNTESADAYIIGSILPVCGALLGHRAWIDFGDTKKYANCFVMLAGKPGDRKSSIINLAEMLARRVLGDESAFLPKNFSPETLFDEFEARPDKLWIVDDANSVLTDFRKSQNGERVSSRMMELCDCRPMSDNFRRNKDSKESGRRREIPLTTMSLLFGATFNIACFQGQSISVRAGLARRFLYYVAERHGRLVVWPAPKNLVSLETLTIGFEPLRGISGPMFLSQRAKSRWEEYQRANRAEMDHTDPLRDAKLSLLSSAPMQTLSIAMIFEACRWAKVPFFQNCERLWSGAIEERTLDLAIEHIDENLKAAEYLDQIANKAEIAQEAEILLGNVRGDFWKNTYPDFPDFIFVTRTDLTRRYCAHSGRRGSWKPDDLYLRFIPHLQRQGEACLLVQRGKQEWFAFRAE
jgi:hypothetical protein